MQKNEKSQEGEINIRQNIILLAKISLKSLLGIALVAILFLVLGKVLSLPNLIDMNSFYFILLPLYFFNTSLHFWRAKIRENEA